LVDRDAFCLPRPDRAHYVLDMMPDFVTLTEEGGMPTIIPVVQVWIDPAYPDAHRAPSFRRWLDGQGICALIRYGSRNGFLLAPPSVTGSGWQEKQSNAAPGLPHSLEDVARVLGEGTEEKLVLDIVAHLKRIER
jgi:hypothetical protein